MDLPTREEVMAALNDKKDGMSDDELSELCNIVDEYDSQWYHNFCERDGSRDELFEKFADLVMIDIEAMKQEMEINE